MLRILLCTLFLYPILLRGQAGDAKTVWHDKVYKNHIGSVKLSLIGGDLVLPVVGLKTGQLLLHFDDLDADVKYYYYTLIHCNKDWTPSSDINPMDYIQGFTEEEIDQYEFSSRTFQPYTHYELVLPNADMSWKISGNYILKVYTDEGPDDPVITRRFIVAENRVIVQSRVTRGMEAGKMQTHQEVDFVVDHEGFAIPNPKQEVSVSILQNGNWGTMKEGIKPMFVKGQKLEYHYQGKIVFPGLREFRRLDLRSLRTRTQNVRDIWRSDDGYDVELLREEPLSHIPYLSEIDMNGNFIIASFDEDDPDLEGDYALVQFNLAAPFELRDGEVYVLGKLTDWALDERFRMEYDEEKEAYHTKAYLKQGFYNYFYVFVPKGEKEPDFGEIDGNDQRTENDYTIIVYFRPFGGRYDQVIGLQMLQSNPE